MGRTSKFLNVLTVMLLFSGIAHAGFLDDVASIVNDSRQLIEPMTLLVIDIVPLLLVLALIGFVVGLFGIILMAIKGGVKF